MNDNKDDGCAGALLLILLIPIFAICGLILTGVGIFALFYFILWFLNFLVDVNQDLGMLAIFGIFVGISALFGSGYVVVRIFFN